jgi:hypothetical protein
MRKQNNNKLFFSTQNLAKSILGKECLMGLVPGSDFLSPMSLQEISLKQAAQGGAKLEPKQAIRPARDTKMVLRFQQGCNILNLHKISISSR